ncbi:uncharacterized protein LOC128882548 [Hylaeus volcanicus]|uniref:uncharacterized protein LOC128882548 n=1 Tax=Hylaeus volcanicus TaxID=313075 RepID=UPI0023B7E3D0|nr:uncharacterized protein LOC128882548 [Hylaeus volcanicus]
MSPSGPIIQVNLNHSARAQDLLMQTLVEWEAGLAVVAEPYRVPNHPNWVGDQLGSATVVWNGRPGSPPLSIIECDRGFLAVRWEDLAVVAIYAPPSWPLAVFERYLDGVGRCISRCLPRPVLVLGDFNSKSQAWGSPETDARGREVLDWAAGLELCLLNTGSVDMYVRWNGGSIVNLSWATPAAARRISGWRVAVEAESLSDHRYVVLGLSAGRNAQPRRRPVAARPPPRWPLKEMDEDALMAAAHVVAWPDGRACRRAGGSPTAPERNEGDMRRRYAPGQGPPEEGGVLLVERDCGYSH